MKFNIIKKIEKLNLRIPYFIYSINKTKENMLNTFESTDNEFSELVNDTQNMDDDSDNDSDNEVNNPDQYDDEVNSDNEDYNHEDNNNEDEEDDPDLAAAIRNSLADVAMAKKDVVAPKPDSHPRVKQFKEKFENKAFESFLPKVPLSQLTCLIDANIKKEDFSSWTQNIQDFKIILPLMVQVTNYFDRVVLG